MERNIVCETDWNRYQVDKTERLRTPEGRRMTWIDNLSRVIWMQTVIDNPALDPLLVDPFSIRMWLELGMLEATPESIDHALECLHNMDIDQFMLLKLENGLD